MAEVDAYFTEAGDITVGPSGDIALTQSPFRSDVQQIYIRMLTNIGDYLIYPLMGADLSRLFGMPQSRATGDAGIKLITSALERENRFRGKSYTVTAVPVGQQAIRLDVSLTSPTQELIKVSISQKLSPQ